MAIEQAPNLGIWQGYPSGNKTWADQMNANLLMLDTLTQLSVKSRALTAPPGSPADGDRYIVAASATGAWVGKDAYVAVWRAGLTAWEFYQPKTGWQAVVENEGTYGTLTTYISSAWSPGTTLG